MTERVRQFIEQEALLDKEACYLVALSGGADSVCLLLMLKELGYRVEAAHCNFHLRGVESDRDEAFVENLCHEHDVTLHKAHFDTREYASAHKVSIEMAARELRYNYFEQLRKDIGAADICVAHHQDDSVETVLMNLLRGTGLRGLRGIQPLRGHIVRPLLCVSRMEIEQWLKERGQTFVTDSTNMVADVVRNKLRLDIIPRLREVFPQAEANILTTVHFVGEALRVYDNAISDSLNRLIVSNASKHCDSGVVGNASKRCNSGVVGNASERCNSGVVGNASKRCDIEQLLCEPSPESILFEWLRPMGFTSAMVEQVCKALPRMESGREWSSATHTLVSHGGFLLLEEKEEERKPLRIPEPGTYVYDDNTKFRVTISEGQHIKRGNALVCSADAKTVDFPLTVRRVCQGDRFRPLGMKGTKLVSDFLTDLHLPITAKRRQLVVCDGNGHIVWIVGRRMDDTKKVTAETAVTIIIEEVLL